MPTNIPITFQFIDASASEKEIVLVNMSRMVPIIAIWGLLLGRNINSRYANMNIDRDIANVCIITFQSLESYR